MGGNGKVQGEWGLRAIGAWWGQCSLLLTLDRPRAVAMSSTRPARAVLHVQSSIIVREGCAQFHPIVGVAHAAEGAHAEVLSGGAVRLAAIWLRMARIARQRPVRAARFGAGGWSIRSAPGTVTLRESTIPAPCGSGGSPCLSKPSAQGGRGALARGEVGPAPDRTVLCGPRRPTRRACPGCWTPTLSSFPLSTTRPAGQAPPSEAPRQKANESHIFEVLGVRRLALCDGMEGYSGLLWGWSGKGV